MDEAAIEMALREPRLIVETGVESQVGAAIEAVITSMGFRLVRVKISQRDGLTLQIMLERADGSLTIEDCELLSSTISPILDVEDLIAGHYNLEVSSPGIDRLLVRISDFIRAIGMETKVETIEPIEGKRKFRGLIHAVGEADFMLEDTEAAAPIKIAFDHVKQARLVLTDDLIRAALRADKQAREQEQNKERN